MFFGGDPFDHFSHGGHGGRPGGGSSNVDTTKLYETLGVSGLMGSDFWHVQIACGSF